MVINFHFQNEFRHFFDYASLCVLLSKLNLLPSADNKIVSPNRIVLIERGQLETSYPKINIFKEQ